jgi:hypothetical protein
VGFAGVSLAALAKGRGLAATCERSPPPPPHERQEGSPTEAQETQHVNTRAAPNDSAAPSGPRDSSSRDRHPTARPTRKGPARAAARGDGGGVHHRDAGHPLHIVHHAAAPHVNVAEELRQGGSEGGCAEGNDDSGGKSDKLDKLEAHASRGLGL